MDQLLPSNLLYNLTLYLTALLGAFVASLWVSLIFWTYRDIRKRTRDRGSQIFASVMAGVLFIPGVFIYLILRPSETLDEVYQKTLEEEALLSSIEEHTLCPGCGARTRPEWFVCPTCHTRLGKPCETCGSKMELSWQLCPSCGTAVPGARLEIIEPPMQSEEPDVDSDPVDDFTPDNAPLLDI